MKTFFFLHFAPKSKGHLLALKKNLLAIDVWTSDFKNKFRDFSREMKRKWLTWNNFFCAEAKKTGPDYFVAHNFIFHVLSHLRKKKLSFFFFCKPCPMTMAFPVSPSTGYTDAALSPLRACRNRRWSLGRGFRDEPERTIWNMLYSNGMYFFVTSCSD